MIRALFVADSLMAGGIESQLVALVTGLDRARFEPHILCLYGPRARDLHFAPHICAANVPLSTPDLGWSTWDKVRGLASIIKLAWAVRPQIIQAEGYHANLLTRLASPLLPPTRLIGSVRGVHSPKQLLYERLSHWLCAQMVVNAPQLKVMLETQAHVPANKVVTILNGITLERFAQPHDPGLRQRIAPDAGRLFVSLGRVCFEKNLHWTVAGFGRLKRQGRLPPDTRLFIVGPTHEDAAQRALDTAIRRDALEGVVFQHPGTAYPEDYYHACDGCILYSPAEGLANVSIEALAAGRPVIISEAANAAGVIKHGVTGWVVRTNDIQHLANTLQTVLALSDEELLKMRAACLQSAQQYAVEQLIQRYSSLYMTHAL